MLKTSLQSWLVIFFFFVLRMYLAIRLICFRHIFCVLCSFLTTMQLFFFFWCINYPEQTLYTYRQRVHIINSSLIVSVMRLLVFELNNIEWCWKRKSLIKISLLSEMRSFIKTDEFYIEWQRLTTSGTTIDKEWQRETTSDNESSFRLIFSNKKRT